MSQRISKKQELNLRQVAFTGLFGCAVLGPGGQVWYVQLDRLVSRRYAHTSLPFLACKLAADELVFEPVHVAAFFAFMTYMQKGSWKEVKAKVQRDFKSTYFTELAFWTAFQTWNFTKVPVRHQLLAVNLASLLDATFLSWVRMHDNWTAHLHLAPHYKGTSTCAKHHAS